ncbi:MAG: ComF family protein [Pseudomonadota bacterium]
MHRLAQSAKAGLRAAAGFVWPQRSILGDDYRGGQGPIEAQDFARLHFLIGTGCRRCALPVEVDLGADSLCARCLARPPRWDQARAALAYDDLSKRVVLDLKHAARRDGLKTMGNWLTLAAGDILADTDALIPVPLHYRRLASRGFNQSAWLARALSKQSQTPVLIDVLKRHRATASQAGLTARQRRRNVAAAFHVPKSKRKKIDGAHLALVDDVYTTGSTLSACTRALKQAGAAQVHVLVLARVVRDADATI